MQASHFLVPGILARLRRCLAPSRGRVYFQSVTIDAQITPYTLRFADDTYRITSDEDAAHPSPFTYSCRYLIHVCLF